MNQLASGMLPVRVHLVVSKHLNREYSGVYGAGIPRTPRGEAMGKDCIDRSLGQSQTSGRLFGSKGGHRHVPIRVGVPDRVTLHLLVFSDGR